MKKMLLIFTVFTAIYMSAQKALCPGVDKSDWGGLIMYSTGSSEGMPISLSVGEDNDFSILLSIANDVSKSSLDGFIIKFDDDSEWGVPLSKITTDKTGNGEYFHHVSKDLDPEDKIVLARKMIKHIMIGEFEINIDSVNASKFQASAKCMFK